MDESSNDAGLCVSIHLPIVNTLITVGLNPRIALHRIEKGEISYQLYKNV